MKMEVCIDSLESALAAFNGGASRIEVCSSLNEGGLTPTIGLYKSIRKHTHSNPGFRLLNMIRPRSGDFLYKDSEIETMCEDIKQFVELDVDGLVFGALTENGLPDESVLNEFKQLIPHTVQTTFHRAFDMCSDWKESLEIIQKLNFTRLLTSGQEKTAFEGRQKIRILVEASQHTDLVILPGSGVNASNLEALLNYTKCTEFHASCRNSRPSKMQFRNLNISMGGSKDIDEYSIYHTDIEKVKELAGLYTRVLSK